MQSLPPGQSVEPVPRHTAKVCYHPAILVPSPPTCHLNCCHHILLLLTPCPCHIPSPPTHGPGSHPSDEERPSSWSLLQLWQARPHHEGLLRTMHPECPECRCYNDS